MKTSGGDNARHSGQRAPSDLLAKFDAALAAGDADAAVEMFAKDSYWRDLVAFTWNIKTMEGRDEAREMLAHCLARVKPLNWRIADGETATEAGGVLEILDLVRNRNRAGLRLIRVKDGLIWTLLTTMTELKGHEEKASFTRPLGARHGVNPGAKTWKELRDEETEKLGTKRSPMCSLSAGARADRAGARLGARCPINHRRTRNERAGNSWRKRYKSLCLHDPVWYDHLPYIDIPQELAGILAEGQDRRLAGNVRQGDGARTTGPRPPPRAQDTTTRNKEWTVVVDRDGEEVTLRPKQMVFATGMSAKPKLPTLQGHGDVQGRAAPFLAASRPRRLQGQEVVVIGSNNSAHDICAALWETGVDVTMMQRSSTHIVRSETLMEIGLGDLYSERAVRGGMTTAKADLIFASLPYRIMNQFQKPLYDKIAQGRCRILRRVGEGGLQA